MLSFFFLTQRHHWTSAIWFLNSGNAVVLIFFSSYFLYPCSSSWSWSLRCWPLKPSSRCILLWRMTSCCQSTPRLLPPPHHKAPYQQLKVALSRKTWIHCGAGWGLLYRHSGSHSVFHSPVVLLHTATANGFQMVTSGAQSKAVSDWAITSLEVRTANFKRISFLSWQTIKPQHK